MATKKKSPKPAAKKSTSTPAGDLEGLFARIRQVYDDAGHLREASDATAAAKMVNESIGLAELFRNVRRSAREFESRLAAGKPAADALDKIVEQIKSANQPTPEAQIEPEEDDLEAVSFGLPFGGSRSATPAAAEAPPDQQFGIKEFLSDVSKSVLEAQKDLDKLSMANLAQLSGSGLPRAMYAIPTVKAELKAGFTSSNGHNISLVLFNKREQRENYGESTVSFELAAVPAPPGAVGSFAVQIPSFLVVGDEREALLKLVGQKLPPAAAASRDRALVVRLEGSAGYQVLWPVQDTKGVRFAAVRQNGDGKTGEVVLPPSATANEEQLQTYIAGLSNAIDAIANTMAAWLETHGVAPST